MRLFNRHKTKSDEALMLLFQEGNQRAFDEVYHRYSKRLLHFMFRMVNNDEALAQDLLHDIFMRLVQQPNRFDTSRNFKSWIFTVAANECYKHHRKRGIVEQVDVLEMDFPILDTNPHDLDQKTFRRALRKELEQLSYDHRCTFILRFQEGLSVKEVSDIMDCSEGTVKSRSHHCLKNLSVKLAMYNPINSD